MSDEPACPSCGVAYTDHDGLIRTCAKLQASPAWHDRPTGPGLWALLGDEDQHAPSFHTSVLNLSQDDLDRGAPFFTKRVYGPIPNDTKGTESCLDSQ